MKLKLFFLLPIVALAVSASAVSCLGASGNTITDRERITIPINSALQSQYQNNTTFDMQSSDFAAMTAQQVVEELTIQDNVRSFENVVNNLIRLIGNRSSFLNYHFTSIVAQVDPNVSNVVKVVTNANIDNNRDIRNIFYLSGFAAMDLNLLVQQRAGIQKITELTKQVIRINRPVSEFKTTIENLQNDASNLKTLLESWQDPQASNNLQGLTFTTLTQFAANDTTMTNIWLTIGNSTNAALNLLIKPQYINDTTPVSIPVYVTHNNFTPYFVDLKVLFVG